MLAVAAASAGLLACLVLSRNAAAPRPAPATSSAQAGPGTDRSDPPSQKHAHGDSLTRERQALALAPENSPVRSHLAVLLDNAQPATQHRKAARSLAELASAESVAALKIALAEGSPQARIAVAEALGACRHQDAFTAAAELVKANEDRLALAAIRGFGDRGDAAAADLLRDVLFSEDGSEPARIEAALSLGTMGDAPGGKDAAKVLFDAAERIREETILQPVFEGIAARPFEECRTFFSAYLGANDVPVELKALALESLGLSGHAPAEFLLQYAAHPDPQVRGAAALGLANTDESGLSASLANLARVETDPKVRVRLYQALGNQENPSPADVLALVQAEKDPAARLPALTLAASLSNAAAHEEFVRYFDQVAVPELTLAALTAPQVGDRIAAVVALSRASSPEAAASLARIARETKDPQVVSTLEASVRQAQNERPR